MKVFVVTREEDYGNYVCGITDTMKNARDLARCFEILGKKHIQIDECNTDDILYIKEEKELVSIRVRYYTGTKCFHIDTSVPGGVRIIVANCIAFKKELAKKLIYNDDLTTEKDNHTSGDDRTEDDQISEFQFLFGKYEEAIQKIEDLEYDIKYTRLAIKMTIDKCLGENNEFKLTSKVTKQDLLNALRTIAVLIDDDESRG